jgi:hypothetical protein
MIDSQSYATVALAARSESVALPTSAPLRLCVRSSPCALESRGIKNLCFICAHLWLKKPVPCLCSLRFPVQKAPFSYLHQFVAIIAYYRLMTPIGGLFPGEKDCLFLWGPASHCVPQSKSSPCLCFLLFKNPTCRTLSSLFGPIGGSLPPPHVESTQIKTRVSRDASQPRPLFPPAQISDPGTNRYRPKSRPFQALPRSTSAMQGKKLSAHHQHLPSVMPSQTETGNAGHVVLLASLTQILHLSNLVL